jgi:hypothetical protein
LVSEYLRVAHGLTCLSANRTWGAIPAPKRILVLPRYSAGIADELLDAHCASPDLLGQERAV